MCDVRGVSVVWRMFVGMGRELCVGCVCGWWVVASVLAMREWRVAGDVTGARVCAVELREVGGVGGSA